MTATQTVLCSVDHSIEGREQPLAVAYIYEDGEPVCEDCARSLRAQGFAVQMALLEESTKEAGKMSSLIATERHRFKWKIAPDGRKLPNGEEWVRRGTCPLHVHATLIVGEDGEAVTKPKTSEVYIGTNEYGWIFWCNGTVKVIDKKTLVEEEKGGHYFTNAAPESQHKAVEIT